MDERMSRHVWTEREAPAGLVSGLEAEGWPRLVARLLAARGIGAADAAGYFAPSLSDLARPEELPGVVEAADAILGAVSGGREVVVFGDYDCDGVCAAAIVAKAVGAVAGREPAVFLPERLSEGYGMNAASLGRMLRENPGVGLVVTVDNGVNSVAEVAELARRGVGVVVTDHHLPGEELPAALALVNPKVAAPPALEGLCGAGVAFMLANAVVSEARRRGIYSGPSVGGPLLVLAGLATVTDMMPLAGQNRILVAEALRRFRRLAPIGLRELFDRASRTGVQSLSSKDFGFLLGPRINAAGRMSSGMDALRLAMCDDRERARELAMRVSRLNDERKNVERDMLAAALERLSPGAAAQVIDLPDGHQGVSGIVAARVLDRLSSGAVPGGPVPVCVVVRGHGSARAPGGYNVRDALAAASGALERFGGHAAAGGFSVKDGCIDAFADLFREACASQAVALWPVAGCASFLDAWVEPGDVTLALAEKVGGMAPFGEGNPEPLFGMRGLHLAEARPLGEEGRHMAVSFRERQVPRAVWWNGAARIEDLRAASASAFDVVFSLEISDYRERHVELRIVDAFPSERAV